jgi:hypothetical protein
VLTGGVSLRTSPTGSRRARHLPGFSIVRLERRLSWWLVRAANGAEGWVPAEILTESGVKLG